jgi:hypothetical protein
MVLEPTDTRKPPSSHTRTTSGALFSWEGIAWWSADSEVRELGFFTRGLIRSLPYEGGALLCPAALFGSPATSHT